MMNIRRIMIVMTVATQAVVTNVKAQNPGGAGATNVVWLKPENFSGGTWTNTGGTVGNFTPGNSGTPPAYDNSAGYNYHRQVRFTKTGGLGSNNAQNYLRSANNYSANNKNTTMFFVFQNTSGIYYSNIIGFNNDAAGNLCWYNNSNTLAVRWGATINPLLTANAGIIAVDISNQNASGSVQNYVNGASTTAYNGGALATYTAKPIQLAANGVGAWGWDGTIQEVIVLSSGGNGTHLSASDRQKIHSYLAIKYGFFMNDIGDYVNSGGTAVWNKTTNNGYNNAIFGIGRDDASGLYQKQSTSHGTDGSNIDNALTVFLGNTLHTYNADNANAFDYSNTYLMLGHNGQGAGGKTPYPLNYTQFANMQYMGIEPDFQRGSRIYKAQVTGTLPSNKISMKTTLSGAKYIMVSNAAAFTPINTRLYNINSNGVATGIQINDGDYISILCTQLPPPGTILFKEDFGAGNANCDGSAISYLAGNSNYQPNCSMNGHGAYARFKQMSASSNWYNLYDHTDPGNGYFFACDAASAAGNFFRREITGLCAETKLYFSAWLVSLNKSQWTHKVRLTFKIYNGNSIAAADLLKQETFQIEDGIGQWENVGFEFQLSSSSSVTLVIENSGLGATGNDFGLDDIEIRNIAPMATAGGSSNTMNVCATSPLKLNAIYNDDGTMGAMKAQWYYSNTPDPTTSAWTTKVGPEFNLNSGVNNVETTVRNLANAQPQPTGYYRLAVAKTGINFDASLNCRSLSNILTVNLDNTCMKLVDDYAIVLKNGGTTINVAANDTINCPATFSIASQPKHASACSINPATGAIFYAPLPNYTGYDTVSYQASCGSTVVTAEARVFAISAIAQKYAACTGAKVEIGMAALPEVSYNWYAGQSDQTPLVDANGVSASNVDSLFIIKNNADPQIVYAEPVVDNQKLNRIPVYIYLGEDCKATEQTMSACAQFGTLLFKEDFGNGPDRCGNPIPQVDPYYTFVCDPNYPYCGLKSNHYTVTKYFGYEKFWHEIITDHTTPDHGYFIAFDATNQPVPFYEKEITGLCSGTKLYFSAWLASLVDEVAYTEYSNLIFRLEDADTGDLLAIYYTGDLENQASFQWERYGFSFETPDGVSSIKLRIINNSTTQYMGNDIVMDDIEIRLCAPEAVIKNYSVVRKVCDGGDLVLDGEYYDDDVFGPGLISRWEFSLTGLDGSWSVLPNSTVSTANDYITNHYVVGNMTSAEEGYYRFIAANPANIDNIRCRAASRIMKVEVMQGADLSLVLNSATVDANGNIIASIDVHNNGLAIMHPIYVTLYADSLESGIQLVTDAINVDLDSNQTESITLTVPNVSQNIFVTAVARVNDDGAVYPVRPECDEINNTLTFLNPDVYNWMLKRSKLNGGPYDGGVYANPASVLYTDVIEYEITAVNVNIETGTVIIADTLPAYLEYQANSATPTPDAISPEMTVEPPARKILKWTITNVPSKGERTVKFKATPESGVVASQPLFVNRATVTVSDTLLIQTNGVYHQGAGISIVTFSAGLGGSIINASPQAVDYRTTARSGVLVVPDSGYRFAGWSHDGYVSMRGVAIPPQEGVMLYDTLTVYGDVELRAVFALDNKTDNIPNEKIEETDSGEKVWSYGSEVRVKTIKPGSIIRVYALDGSLLRQQTALSTGETLVKLPHGIYIVTVNNGIGHKVAVSD